ncbi:alpha-galactosidase [Curtobacterium sp. ISL-83]|uniref:alpha-galactosidase n=1 Tax=Curtobacterium sp. ISL-83 TaxID=2819145 RepID=UPI0027DFD433|nr:alpha-galactosidase [Curtobacterium sp. ISL-83]
MLQTRADHGGALAWQIEHNGGWRWEVGEDLEGTSLALSGPTDADHQWLAVLHPGEDFTTVPATVAAGDDLEDAIAELTDFRRLARRTHPDNTALGVVFNDYMNTLMGDPTTAKLLPLIDAAAEAGAQYFMIDAGWYDDSGDWWYSVGDWLPSTVRFPGGLAAVVERIRQRDMIPGLWLEPEVVGVDSPAAERLPADAFLSRNGVRVVEHGRYHLDLRHPAAIAHLNAVIDRLVTDMGVGYFKLDYNINPGAGTDIDAVSPGSGLLAHNRAHLAWLDSVLDRHPDLVLENCGSGAMRMDQAMLSRLQLQSTTDQQDPEAYPPIAAAAPLMMLPEQAANWAYPQPNMDDEALAFTLCTAILGRFYLSGHVDTMSTSQTTLVAEAVAAHKRLRHDLAAGHASWPLGIEQWTAPWVALAIGTRDQRYLTLWRRTGSLARISVPLPDLVGQAVFVDTVFPTRLEPWEYRWDADAGVLHVTSTGPEVAARTIRITTSRAQVAVTVDATAVTGTVHGGASGMLYGLGDVGVPSAALVAGVRPRTVAQKAPGGAQHPGGDAAELADGFFAAGGAEVVVYLQDALSQWPYEEIGIEGYATLVRDLVTQTAERPDRSRFVWVPFNEGDWIWYADWSPAGRDRFLADWVTIHQAIRSVDPAARIAGPNESRYHPDRVTDFLTFAAAHDVLPDVMSWHELQPSSLERYPNHYAHYRALERHLGLNPLPINIDEYGNRRDMSNPGQLIQWLALFEDTKVDADLAYWTMAGNLDDHAVGINQANGGWWLLHWYASLTGQTVGVATQHAGVRDSVRAIAARDGAVLRVIVGGTADAIALRVAELPSGHKDVRLRISQVTWSGYEGDAQAPVVLDDRVVAVTDDDALVVNLPGGDPQAAFLVVITPNAGGVPVPAPPWALHADVSEAEVVGAEMRRHGDDPQEYAAAGRVSVAALPHPWSSVEFPVTVPKAGEYLLGIVYGTEGRPAGASLVIDGVTVGPVEFPATLSRTYAGRMDIPVLLAAGPHRISLCASALVASESTHDIAVQRLIVTEHTLVQTTRYDAVDARLAGGAALRFDAVETPTGIAAVELGRGSATFFVATRRRGAHVVNVEGQGDVAVTIDGRAVSETGAPITLTLPLGVSVIRVTASGRAVVQAVAVSEAPPVEVQSWSFDPPVERWDDGREVELTLDGNAGGEFLLTVEYSNASRMTGHLYNADVITTILEARVGGRDAVAVPCRFTNSWDTYREVSVPFTIERGDEGPVILATSGRSGVRVARVTLEPLVLRS